MACLDILIRGQYLPTWQHGVRLDAIAVEGGGPVATALAAAQRLGAKTGFIGTCGNDRLGAIKLQTLADFGVDTSKVIHRDNPENQVVLVAVQSITGERIFSGSHVESVPLRISELDKDYVLQAKFLHLDGYHAAAANQAAMWMKDAGKQVMLDGSATSGPISEDMKTLVSLSDYVICGKGFGLALTGEHDLFKAGKAIMKMGPGVVVQTEGRDGSYTVSADGSFHTPAFDVPVVDTTGAGDVYHGAFLVGLLLGWKLPDVVLFSTAVSAIKCMQLSGRRGIPTFEQTMQFLKVRGIVLD
jgi:sugar/nucleoside kinase (ribokinase family)